MPTSKQYKMQHDITNSTEYCIALASHNNKKLIPEINTQIHQFNSQIPVKMSKLLSATAC